LKTKSKILLWDLETSNLSANIGHILMVAAKWLGEKKFALSMRIDDTKGFGKTPESFSNDKAMVEGLVKLLNECDASVAHYGERFDKRFLITRALRHGVQPPAPTKLVDTWRVSRSNLALTSNRLATICEALDTPHKKGKLDFSVWQLAVFGHKPSLEAMQKYNRLDVLALEDAYIKLLPLIGDHPNCSGKHGTCNACGSEKLQQRGYRLTKVFRIVRLQCQNCGNWMSGKQEKIT
jgi:DNA polymerase elongation subunit (family B)